VIVRLARDTDRQPALEIERRAFGRADEAAVAAAVWDEGGSFGLVAEDKEGLIGHVQFSTATIGSTEVLALGPIGVVPEHQRRGVGRALIDAGLNEARSRGGIAVILLGAPAYYGPFGFRPGTSFGLSNPYAGGQEDGFVVAEEDFQVLIFEPGRTLRGDVRWHAAFGEPAEDRPDAE
jgi:putative acetyltransferase